MPSALEGDQLATVAGMARGGPRRQRRTCAHALPVPLTRPRIARHPVAGPDAMHQSRAATRSRDRGLSVAALGSLRAGSGATASQAQVGGTGSARGLIESRQGSYRRQSPFADRQIDQCIGRPDRSMTPMLTIRRSAELACHSNRCRSLLRRAGDSAPVASSFRLVPGLGGSQTCGDAYAAPLDSRPNPGTR